VWFFIILPPPRTSADFFSSYFEAIFINWVVLLLKLNAESKSINERGPSLVVSLCLSCQYKRFLIRLGCSSPPSTKYFYPHRTLFPFLRPHRPASWAGSRAGSPVFVSVSVVSLVLRWKHLSILLLPIPVTSITFPWSSSLKVHKIENFLDSDFGICVISLIVMSKY
jgi:hypothetical protein